MASNLGDMVVSIVGDTTGLSKSLTESQKKMAAFGVNVAAITAAMIQLGKQVAKATKEFSDYGSLIDDSAKRTGLSTDAIQEWKYIAEQAGTTLEAVTGAVGMMTRGLETNREEFKRLGIETKNADGSFKSTTEIFNDTVLTLSEMEDETARDAAAFKLLGRSAQSLIPILKDGEAGINAMKEEAQNLGLILDKETITQADALGDAMLALKTSMTAAKNNMINEMAPALIKIAYGLKDIISKTINSKKEWEAFVKATKGQVTTLEQLSLAIKGVVKETARLESLNNELYSEGQYDDQIAANKVLEASLRAQAKALASAAEANRLGTDAARVQAQLDADAAIVANEKLRKLEEETELLNELLQARLDGEVAQTEAYNLRKVAEEEAFKSYIDGWIEGDIIVGDVKTEIHEKTMEQIEAEKNARIASLTYAYGQIQSIMDQVFSNEIDNINNSTDSEEEKAKKIAQVKRKQAIWDKATAIADVAINTAGAIVKALPNLFLAGLVGALGVAQAAVIAATHIPALPLADGGIVMPTEGGTLAQIAEAGQPEAVIPLDKLGSLGGNIHLVVQMDSKPFLDKIFPATRDRTILISAGAVV